MILFNHIHVIGIQLHVTPSKSRVMDQDRSHVTESDRFGDLPVGRQGELEFYWTFSMNNSYVDQLSRTSSGRVGTSLYIILAISWQIPNITCFPINQDIPLI